MTFGDAKPIRQQVAKLYALDVKIYDVLFEPERCDLVSAIYNNPGEVSGLSDFERYHLPRLLGKLKDEAPANIRKEYLLGGVNPALLAETKSSDDLYRLLLGDGHGEWAVRELKKLSSPIPKAEGKDFFEIFRLLAIDADGVAEEVNYLTFLKLFSVYPILLHKPEAKRKEVLIKMFDGTWPYDDYFKWAEAIGDE